MARIYIPQGWFRECGSLLEAEEGRGGAESRLRTSLGDLLLLLGQSPEIQHRGGQ